MAIVLLFKVHDALRLFSDSGRISIFLKPMPYVCVLPDSCNGSILGLNSEPWYGSYVFCFDTITMKVKIP